MIPGLRVLILGLCIASVITLRADAQQSTPANTSNRDQMVQIVNEMQGLQQQLQLLRTQMQQLMAQKNAVMAKILPIEQRMKVDRDQLRILRGNINRQGQPPAAK